MIEKNALNQFCVSGAIDFDNVSQILKKAQDIIDQEIKEIIFNFSELKQSNSAGLALLTALLRYAHEKQKNIQFLHLSGQLWSAAKISNLDKILPCEPL